MFLFLIHQVMFRRGSAEAVPMTGLLDGFAVWQLDNDENIYVGDISNNKILKFKKVLSN